MPIDPRTPVLVGAGQFLQRASGLDDALDASALMAEAVRLASVDAGLTSVPNPDSLRVVGLLSWRYGDPAWVVAQQLGISPRETALTTTGGNNPQTLVNTTALEIQRGEVDLVVLAGGEAWRTRMRARKAGATLVWPKAPAEQIPRLMGDEFDMTHPAERARGLTLPVQVYPMFETAIRARAGRSVADHQLRVGELWARFSEVAASNPYAWLREAKTATELSTVGPTNRMIGLPYPKYMNSNNDVDMAAALIMCSAERASALGIPRDRWVFPQSGVDCHEHAYVSNRWSFAATPAIELGGRQALDLAGTTIDEVDIVDLYSCFPSAVQLGAQSLGLAIDRQLTRTGGLAFAGGPWNSYVMHSIATVVGDLPRAGGFLRARVGQWRAGHQALLRHLSHLAASRWLPAHVPPARDRRDAPPRAHRTCRRGRAGDDRGLHRHALTRGRARVGLGGLPSRRWQQGVGVILRTRPHLGDVRRRVGGARRDPRRRRHPPRPLTADFLTLYPHRSHRVADTDRGQVGAVLGQVGVGERGVEPDNDEARIFGEGSNRSVERSRCGFDQGGEIR